VHKVAEVGMRSGMAGWGSGLTTLSVDRCLKHLGILQWWWK